MSIKEEVIAAKNNALRELQLLRDETKLRAHLLSLDARQRWDELESAILGLEQRANQEGERAGDLLADKIKQLSHRLSELVTTQMGSSAGLLTSVRSLMSRDVCCCSPADSLNQAAQVMWEHDCGIVPVVDHDQVVGLLTDRDLCMATYTQGAAPSQVSVASAMSHAVYGCRPDDSLGEALSIMAAKRVRRLPVLDADGRLLGILALADVARFARSAANPRVDAALSETLSAIAQRPSAPAAAAAE